MEILSQLSHGACKQCAMNNIIANQCNKKMQNRHIVSVACVENSFLLPKISELFYLK